MATDTVDGNRAPEALPPTQSVIYIEVEPEPESKKVVRYPMARRGAGTRGDRVTILTNHFKVNVRNLDGDFFHYSVAISYEDGRPVHGKGVRRKLLDQVLDILMGYPPFFHPELAGKEFAYDGDKSLFTVASLGLNKLEFVIVLEDIRNNGNSSPENDCDRKRLRLQYPSKTYKVGISFAAKIPMKAIANALRGQDSESNQKAIRVLDILLRQHAARQGCLLVGQSFFHNDAKNFTDVGGGIFGLRGFCSSFRTTQSGLSLNIDVSTTMIIQPGPVMDFLLANQNVRDPSALDWVKVKCTLKNLRITTSHANKEYKITGLSEKPCREQLFTLKQKKGDGDIEGGAKEVTVYDYFVNHLKIDLRCSADFPCINVGKPMRPTYFPIELCSLVSLQRYTKALSTFQRSSLLEKSRQKPEERMSVLRNALKINNYGADPMLRSCGVSISSSFTQVTGRVLPTPKLKVAYGEELCVQNGRWNFNNKEFICPCKIENWAVVNFSSRCDIYNLVRDLKRVGQAKGITVEDPFRHVFEESYELCRAPPLVRVDKMFEELQRKLPGPPKFLLCLLSERKNSDLYGPWKHKSLSDLGIVSQCLAPTRVDDQYLTNLLLKINAKLGGVSFMLAGEVPATIPVVSKVPTLILGMDVSHCSPGRSDTPSIAAVVSSRQWPSVCHYKGVVRTQSPKLEMMDSLYKRVSETKDDGIMNEVLLDFYTSSRKRKPDQIIIFRDGVSESQFNQVLNIELNQIIEACKFLEETWCPKFVVIIAQKNHRTKFFLPNCPDNVQPGTIIDYKVCHPKNNDFYLCAHAGMIGTTRPIHYHVLLDEVRINPDDLQELVHSLSYVYQRSTTAVSVVAPICYAHLAASQLGQWMKFQDASSHNETGSPSVPPMPKLHENVRNTMFFC